MIARLTGGLLFLSGFVALFLAYWTEHVLGYAPCELCLIERMPGGLSRFWACSLSSFREPSGSGRPC
nr:disulfide bond formation protein B [Asaia astilbis]